MNQAEGFKMNQLPNRKPMKLMQERGGMTGVRQVEKVSCVVLDDLQLVQPAALST